MFYNKAIRESDCECEEGVWCFIFGKVLFFISLMVLLFGIGLCGSLVVVLVSYVLINRVIWKDLCWDGLKGKTTTMTMA